MSFNAKEYRKQWEQAHKHPCPVCGKLVSRQAESCYNHRKNAARGERNANWRGGRGRNPAGYIWIYAPNHQRANARRQVWEHIVVWENAHGPTPKGWQIHHINGIRDDNRLENLIALPPKSHHHSSPLKELLKKARARIRELEYQVNHENKLL